MASSQRRWKKCETTCCTAAAPLRETRAGLADTADRAYSDDDDDLAPDGCVLLARIRATGTGSVGRGNDVA